MSNWQKTNQKFMVPYNFVPLGNSCKRSKIKEDKEGVTGYVECTITPKTDLFIPNTSTDNAFGTYTEALEENKRHKSYEFFSYEDISDKKKNISEEPEKPVIPGSEIRGMIRSAFEALTDSCFVMDYNKSLFTREPNPKQAGVLIFDKTSEKWNLYQAERKKINVYGTRTHRTTTHSEAISSGQKKLKVKNDSSHVEYATGDVVKYRTNGKSGFIIDGKASSINEKNSGVLLVGERTSAKGFESIFSPSNNSPISSNNNINFEEPVKKLKEVLELYRDKTVNLNLDKTDEEEKHYGYKGYELDKTKPVPVYYRKVAGKYYLAPACISKNAYYNILEEIVKNHTGTNAENFLPCKNKDKLCPACNLFGIVKEGGEGVTSKIRITDATFSGSTPPEYGQVTPIKILAGPKFRCMEFYTQLKDNDSNYWNFDYDDQDISIMDSIRLNGRKMYWHHKSAYKSDDREGQNITIRPLKPDQGNKFQFKVYFDNIRQEDLKRLLVVLSIGDNESRHCHKIGMGKPLGLGSVKIKIEKVLFRKLTKEPQIELSQEDVSEIYKSCFNGFFKEYLEKEEKADNNVKVTQENMQEQLLALQKKHSGKQYKENKEKINEDKSKKHVTVKMLGTNEEVVKAFLAITDFNSTKGLTVSYPMALNEKATDFQEASYHWHCANKIFRGAGQKQSDMNWQFQHTLPKAVDAKTKLANKYVKRYKK